MLQSPVDILRHALPAMPSLTLTSTWHLLAFEACTVHTWANTRAHQAMQGEAEPRILCFNCKEEISSLLTWQINNQPSFPLSALAFLFLLIHWHLKPNGINRCPPLQSVLMVLNRNCWQTIYPAADRSWHSLQQTQFALCLQLPFASTALPPLICVKH